LNRPTICLLGAFTVLTLHGCDALEPTSVGSAEAPAGPIYSGYAPLSPSAQKADCEERYLAIAQLKESASRCTQSSDCKIIGGSCPFGCTLAVNPASPDYEPMLIQMSSYHRRCPQCLYRCLPQGTEPVCCDGRCWRGDGELGLRNPGACHNQCYTEAFQDWVTSAPEPNNFY
jgi:hypothetical protein